MKKNKKFVIDEPTTAAKTAKMFGMSKEEIEKVNKMVEKVLNDKS